MASNMIDIQTETAFLDISQLTEQAKQELMDFYQFLLERYGVNQRSPQTLPDIFYHPVKTRTYQPFNRDAIYDGR